MRSIRREGNDVKLLRRTLDVGLAKAVSVLDNTQMKYGRCAYVMMTSDAVPCRAVPCRAV